MDHYAVQINGTWVRVAGAFTVGDEAFASNWLELSTPQDKADKGIKAYTPVGDPPAGQRSLGKVMVDDNGSPKEIHQLEDIPLAERKAEMLAAVDALRDATQESDFTYDFGDIEAKDDEDNTIAAGVRSLQMRYAPDQRNWQALQSQAAIVPEAARDAVVMPMRAEDNWNVQTTATNVLAATTAMFLRNAAILFFGGELKSKIRAAATGSQLDAIDITVGWPT